MPGVHISTCTSWSDAWLNSAGRQSHGLTLKKQGLSAAKRLCVQIKRSAVKAGIFLYISSLKWHLQALSSGGQLLGCDRCLLPRLNHRHGFSTYAFSLNLHFNCKVLTLGPHCLVCRVLRQRHTSSSPLRSALLLYQWISARRWRQAGSLVGKSLLKIKGKWCLVWLQCWIFKL